MMRRCLILGLMAVLVGCGPDAVDTSKDKFLIYNYNPQTSSYGLERATIRTLQDVTTVDGTVAYLRGGGSIQQTSNEPQTEKEWEEALWIDGSSTPVVEYTLDDDGTVLPWDFDSAMMLTVYHHLERSAEFFDRLPTEELGDAALKDNLSQNVGRIACYYYPRMSILGFSVPLPLFTDNAAYAYTMDAFLVPPRFLLTDAVPLYANRGVMTHEYGHAMFNRLVHNDRRAPDFLLNEDKWSKISLNELGSLDEGVADIWAALDTKNPNFIAPSIGEDLVDRNMTKVRYYETCMAEAISSGTYPKAEDCGGSVPGGSDTHTYDSKGVRYDRDGDEYDIYHLGATIASTFWAMRERVKDRVSDDELGKVLTSALRSIQNPGPTFRVVTFFDGLHAALPADAKADACAVFTERLPAISDTLACNTQ